MPNFTAKIRTSYRDIDALLLDCRPDGLALDGSVWTNTAQSSRAEESGSHTGPNNAADLTDSTKMWRVGEHDGKTIYNVTDGSYAIISHTTATQIISLALAGGTDNDWDTGDEYVIGTQKFGDLIQPDPLYMPVVTTVGGFRTALFTLADSQFMVAGSNHYRSLCYPTLMVDVPGLAVDATVNQRLVTIRPVPAGREFRFLRRNGAGNYGSYAGGVSLSGAGDLTVGSWMYTATAPATADIDKNGVADLSGASSYIDIADGDPALGTASLFVGGVPGVQYCTAAIRAIAIWARPLSVLERDFAWQTFCPVAPGSMNTLSRATMEIRDWTDTTDVARASRVNPRMAAQQKFIVAKYTAGSMPRVQCSALVDDLAWPDTGLDGDLFSWDCYEHPAGSPPTFFQDAGISCIADVRLDDPGHYTIVASRANGGSVVLHLDAEEI